MQVFNTQKLAELIIFFAKHSQDDRLFGSTKLNKLLWAADFLAYGHLGHSITGTTYIHQEQGPTPLPIQFLPVRASLINSKRLHIVENETYAGMMHRPIANSEPDLSIFDEDELDLCLDVLANFSRMSNREVSNWSHEFVGWRYTRQGETIPYQTVFFWEKEPVTKDDFEWAIRTIESLDNE